MKRIFFISIIIMLGIVFADAHSKYQRANVQAAPVQQNNTQYVSPTFEPTRTPIPSATIGYESTLQIAQATADEARRINAQVTSEHEQRILEQLQLTAEHEARVQEIYSWTATAALTSIPLTSTQQAIVNTQVLDEQRIIAAQMTATQQAPTQIAAFIQAEQSIRYVRLNNFVSLIARIVLILFMLALIYLISLFADAPKQIAPDPTGATVVLMKHDHGQGNFSLVRTVVPCSPDQLTELAEKITRSEKTLAINQWEGAGTLFTRPIIHQVRGWMQLNEFAVPTGDGQLAPTVEGLEFLLGWLESQKLPDEYEFSDEKPEMPDLPRQDVNDAESNYARHSS